MISRRQVKFIFSGLVLVFSIFAILLSDSSSKLSAPFEKEELTPHESEDVYEEEVLGQSDFSSVETEEADSDADLSEVEKNSSNDQENEQVVDEGYKLIKVVDGDTLDVEIEGKIERLRLIGIDTPETVDPRKSVQCFGREASNKAKELLDGELVTLESDGSQGDRDKYRRLLRYVFLPDGTNFNLYMISEGYAHEYTYDNPYKYQFDFKQAQKSAMENERGLWSPSTCSGNK